LSIISFNLALKGYDSQNIPTRNFFGKDFRIRMFNISHKNHDNTFFLFSNTCDIRLNAVFNKFTLVGSMKLRKSHSIAAFIIFLFSILLLSPSTYAVIRTVEGTVTKVSDGDTLQVITPEGTKLRVRLYGCDAPETEKVNRRTGQISSG